MAGHDTRYKKLFSNPNIMRELVESFVHEDWVRDIDFSRAERIETSFVTDGFRERESDLIWKVPCKGSDIYIYLLIEFQSTVDRFMALRVLRYVCEFYQHLIETRRPRRGEKLPAIFPMVLYSGEARWTAPVEISELIDQRVGFSPRFRYYKLAENEFLPDILTAIDNLVAALFIVETVSPGELREKVNTILTMLKKEGHEEVELFRLWLANFFGVPQHELVEAIEPITEVQNMFETKLKQYRKELLQEGRHEEKVDIARRLKARGMDIDTIVEVTGLPKSEIEGL